MAQRVYAIVTNTIPSGSAFAVREDNDECIYIPASLAMRMEVESFDRVEAVVVRNRLHPETTPWIALRLRYAREGEDRNNDVDGTRGAVA